MSKSLRSYPAEERLRVINRRLEEETGGLGYWAAKDAELARLRASIHRDRSKPKPQEPISPPK